MTDEKKPSDPKPPADDKATAAPKITRRRFTKAGVVTPIVMTLGSRPVWGQTCSFSGQLSGNDYSTAAPDGTGQPPSYWDGLKAEEWPVVGQKYDEKKGTFEDIRVSKNDSISTYVQGYDTCNYFGSAQFKDLLGKNVDGVVKAQAAAAVLGVLAGNYGYGMDGVMSFLCSSAMAHENEVLEILQRLNSTPRPC